MSSGDTPLGTLYIVCNATASAKWSDLLNYDFNFSLWDTHSQGYPFYTYIYNYYSFIMFARVLAAFLSDRILPLQHLVAPSIIMIIEYYIYNIYNCAV